MAKQQLISLEKKLHTDQKLLIHYVEFLREYEELGHMREVQGVQISEIINSDFYVDDTLDEATNISLKISEILAQGQFQLQRWKSNGTNVFSIVNHNPPFELTQLGQENKTLGLFWSCEKDILMYKVNFENTNKQVTKRIFLSVIARIFDPLKLISPCTLLAKILLQKLWLTKISWDGKLPKECEKIWSQFTNELPAVNEIPRKVICKESQRVEFHCFSDASQSAYGGCIYVRSKNPEGEWNVELLCAKGKVAPYMGGIWESAVKICKHHLRRVLHTTALTFEEFYTILVQIEAILNSRLLTPMSSDPNDLQPLTLAHFLIGRTLTSLPDPPLTTDHYRSLQINRLSRYQLLQNIQQHFWKRWSKEYISELQRRVKWQRKEESLHTGDLVIVMVDNLPPKYWKLGRVTTMYPGKDDVIRVADIKTPQGTIRRSIHKLCPLPI